MHLILKRETTRPPGVNALQKQARFDALISEFNEERPHEALAMRMPAEVYTPSLRAYDGLPEIDPVPRQRCARHCLRPHLHAPQEDQHLHYHGQAKARNQESR